VPSNRHCALDSALPRVVVAGGIDMDITISVDRHPLPGEELAGSDLRFLPGGKGANQAVAAARAGARVSMVGCVGRDPFGDRMVAFLQSEQVDTSHVERLDDVPTGVALVVVASDGENTIVYSAGASQGLALDRLPAMEPGDVLISQLEVPTAAILRVLGEGRRRGAVNVFNAAPRRRLEPGIIDLVDVLVVNEFELALAIGRGGIDPANRTEVAAAVGALSRPADQVVIVTLGAAGAVVFDRDRTVWIDAHPVAPVDTTGAGDAFVGALGAALCRGASLDDATAYANASAAMAVTRRGAGPSMPFRAEVESGIASNPAITVEPPTGGTTDPAVRSHDAR